MKSQEVIDTVARAGIDPVYVFKGLKCLPTPGLRPPTARELVVIRSFTNMPLVGASESPHGYAGYTDPDAPWGPKVGADSPMATVLPGWNVWAVWQVQDLPFSIPMVGVSRDRQLRIWVEDQIRLNAPEAQVADPLDLKGSQIQILTGDPGLKTAMRKENVPGPALTVETQDLPPQLRFVRFFNRGGAAKLPWPHDESYLLDAVFAQDPSSPVTTGDGPGTITSNTITKPAAEAGKKALDTVLVIAVIGALGLIAVEGFKHRNKE